MGCISVCIKVAVKMGVIEISVKDMFEQIGIFIEKNTGPILAVAAILILLSFVGAQRIEMASGIETFVEKESRLYQDFDLLYRQYFGTLAIVVMVENGDVTTPEVLHAIDRLDTGISATLNVVGVVNLATMVRQANLRGSGRDRIPDDQSAVRSLIDSIPEHQREIVLPDTRHTAVYVTMPARLTDPEMIDVLADVEDVVELASFPPGYNVIVTGQPAFYVSMQDEMKSSMGPLLMIASLLMVVVLFIAFKHARWRLLPLPIVIIGIVWTFGAMGFLGIPLTIVSLSAFPILIGLGIDYAIQFHNRLEEEFARSEDAKKAVLETVRHTAPAVMIAVIITGLGFVSLFTSTVPMIKDFGLLCLIGIICCFFSALFIEITVIYSLHRNKNNRQNRKQKNARTTDKNVNGAAERLFGSIAVWSARNPLLVLGVAGSLCFAGLYADTMIGVETDVMKFMPPEMPALIDIDHMVEVLGGVDQLNLIIKVDDVTDPSVLEWMDRFSEHEVESHPYIFGADSIVGPMKMMNQGVLPDDAAGVDAIMESIPESTRDRYIYGRTTALINLGIGDAISGLGLPRIDRLTKLVMDDVRWTQPPPGVTVTITGDPVAMTAVLTALTTGRRRMTFVGLILILGGLFLLYRDWLKAAIPVLTMTLVIGWSSGVMYALGIDYTPMTATLGALILGIGSEYAVMMTERYFEERGKGLVPIEAIRISTAKIGTAIAASGFTTLAGFSALLASPFSLNRNFGIVTVIDVLLALIASFFVFPVLVVWLDRMREEKRARRGRVEV
uniref:Protein-export membrane protein SecF n=2 Tax=Candidatus Methanogaster sp. ANME-2c ERB4 TaxID=2759911 RepID=A0A7G9YIJ8_9EURY|nr:protein-export membrane protein SecF [Methanosarcinales archaeon ANME-2c ERB4]